MTTAAEGAEAEAEAAAAVAAAMAHHGRRKGASKTAFTAGRGAGIVRVVKRAR